MALSREQKEKIVEDLVEKLSKMKTLIFVDFTGLDVAQMFQLRRQLKKEEAEFKVVKKTLVKLSLKKFRTLEKVRNKIDIDQLKGQLALAFGYKDELSVIKVLDRFSKENKALKILTGIVGNDYLESEMISALAQLPSKEELLAKLINNILSPISGLINVLEGNLRNLVFVLSEIKK